MTPLVAIIGAGLVLGAAGSGHCAVMCGPLVVLAQPQMFSALVLVDTMGEFIPDTLWLPQVAV